MKKFFIFISVIFLVLLLSVELYVQSDKFSLLLRPYVLAPLKDVLGGDAKIGGIQANFIPMYVEALDVSLPDDRGRRVAAIRRIRIYINPLPLLLKKIRLPSIVLLEPSVYGLRSREGELNLTSLIDRITSRLKRAAETDTAFRFKIMLKKISLNEGRITFKDELTSAETAFSEVQATARVKQGGDSFTVTLRNAKVSTVASAYPEFTGTLSAAVRYDRKRIHFDSLELSTGDTSVSLSGSIGSLPDPDLDMQLDARSGPLTIGKFAWLLKYFRKEQTSHLFASARLQGRLSNPRADGIIKLAGISHRGLLLRDAALAFVYENKHLAIDGKKWKVVRGDRSIVIDSISAALRYRERGLDIQRFAVEAGDLSIHASGRADAQRGFDSLVTAESRDKGRTLSFLASVPLEGSVRVDGYLRGMLNAPLFDGAVAAGPLTVRRILFDSAAGRIQYDNKTIRLVSVDIVRQSSRYFFNGSVDFSAEEPLFSARLKVIRSDVGSIVALFYRPLPLYFSATGDLSFFGTRKDFAGSGKLALGPGSAYGESFVKGFVTAALTKNRIAFPEVIVDKGSGSVKGSGWIGFDRTYSASIESIGVTLSEVNLVTGAPVDGPFRLSIESSGSFSQPEVTSVLAMENLFFNELPLGALFADLKISNRMLICKASLGQQRTNTTINLSLRKPYTWSAQAAFDEEMLDPFLLFKNEELRGRATMTVGGTLALRGRGTNPSALAGSAWFKRFGLTFADYAVSAVGITALAIEGDRVSVKSMNFSGQGTTISVAGSVRLMKEMDVSITGSANLALLRPLFHDLEYIDGTAGGKIAITESWSKPYIDGELLVRDAEIKVKDFPQKFSVLSGRLNFDESRIILDSLTAQLGGGIMSASGKAERSGLELTDFSSRIAFENVTLKLPQGLTSALSGEVYFDGDSATRSLIGDVSVKRARYDKRVEWKSMLVDIGKGFHHRKKSEAGWIGDTEINLRFSGKDNILFQNNLAKVPLDVDVFFRGTVSRPQLLGRIEARKGSVYFRQNEFKIMHASVDFVDPNRINPVLDIQAAIRVREYLVRLAVSGTADRAVVTLLSDPPLADSDILALLALGKTGEELQGKEAGVGMSEAASFATGQFQDLFESRARSLTGLDRFQVDPYISKGDTSVPRVTVGKEIMQDRLYVTYSSNIGSTTPEQIFRVEYILNKYFSLVGERNELGNTGADIKYRFEFE